MTDDKLSTAIRNIREVERKAWDRRILAETSGTGTMTDPSILEAARRIIEADENYKNTVDPPRPRCVTEEDFEIFNNYRDGITRLNAPFRIGASAVARALLAAEADNARLRAEAATARARALEEAAKALEKRAAGPDPDEEVSSEIAFQCAADLVRALAKEPT